VEAAHTGTCFDQALQLGFSVTTLNAIVKNCEAVERCYQGADKSLARPGRKQAQKHARDAHNFNKIEKQAVFQVSFPARQGAEGNSCHSDRNIGLFPSWLD